MSIFVRSSKESSLVVSSVIRVEIATAISRLRKGGLLLPDEASAALSFLKAAIDHMDEEPVTSILLQTAATLGSPYALRALDSIQLASAVSARLLRPQDEMRFIASDKELLEAAQKEGFITWNPCD
jgi:predicted nucleic acid-binding protein